MLNLCKGLKLGAFKSIELQHHPFNYVLTTHGQIPLLNQTFTNEKHHEVVLFGLYKYPIEKPSLSFCASTKTLEHLM